MLTYSFSDIGSDSLYEHLYKCIKKDIITGVLKADTKLPSKRSFAKNLALSNITIENAYSQLMAEGYIYSINKKGYYVAKINNQLVKPKDNQVINESNIDNKNKYFADFLSNSINKEDFPFNTWVKIMKDVSASNKQELLTPCNSQGIYELRSAIKNYLSEFRGINISCEQIIIGAGTEYLYSLLIQLLGRNNIFAIEDPGYNKISKIYKCNDVKCRHIPLDECGININKLEDSMADIVHISPSHHYPTGKVMPISRRYELLSWASKKDNRYILEDDYDCEFRLQGKPIPALQSIDCMDKVIYLNTFTKSLSPTIRISYMVLPKPLINKFNSKLNFYSCTVSNFEQYTLAKFINDGYFEKHINKMRNIYKCKRDLILNYVKTCNVKDYLTIKEEDAGLHFLLYVKTKLTDKELIKKAQEKRIQISCLSNYYYNKENAINNVIVINYSSLEKDKINEAVKRLLSIL